MNADKKEAPDRGELVLLMEPMRISETSRHRRDLADLAVELAAHSTGFRRSLPEGVLVIIPMTPPNHRHHPLLRNAPSGRL